MKRFLILLAVLFVFCKNNYSNPIVVDPPLINISELYFDSENKWHLELEVNVIINPLYCLVFDSIQLRSNTSTHSFVTNQIIGYHMYVFDQDNFPDFIINQEQDTLQIIAYLNYECYMSNVSESIKLIYGYSGCSIPVLYPGQSICFENNYFYKTNYPNIGFENLDYIDYAKALVYGNLYDQWGTLVNNSNLNEYSISLDKNIEAYYYYPDPYIHFVYHNSLFFIDFSSFGNYFSFILPRQTTINSVQHYYNYYDESFIATFNCTPVNLNMEPGDTVYTDIQIIDTNFTVGLHEHSPLPASLYVVCSPNPFSSNINFFIDSKDNLSDMSLLIFNIKGEKVKEFALPAEKSININLTKAEIGKSGTYVYIIIKNGKNICSGQIICN
ncbi:MAG: T9SS type A sorting domain-containing protein [Lentimicrobiaceae bacterium]|nr:T9SS type A sorting domain-containing protein [Lentimicrobiaceae bacterium]